MTTGTNSKNPWADKRIFTTGEAAEVCKVSQQTIIRCFDSGRLSGFRVPGSKFRRIPREELIRFMRTNNIPVDTIEDGLKRILAVDDDPQILEMFVAILSKDPRFEVKTASSGYDAGLLTESFRPHLMLLDYKLPDINGNLVCNRVRSNPSYKDMKILIISGVVSQSEIQPLMASGANDFLKKPFNIGTLMQKITSLLEIEDTSGAKVAARGSTGS